MNNFSKIQQTLIDYWLSLPRDAHALVPRKALVKLSQLFKIAPHLGMAEYIGPYHVNVRLVGSEVDNSIGVNVQHTNAFDLYAENSRDAFDAMWSASLQQPCGMINVYQFHHNKPTHFDQTSMHLPMCDDNGVVCFVLSTFEASVAPDTLEPIAPGNIDMKRFRRLVFLDVGAGVPAEFPYFTPDRPVTLL